LTVNHRTTYRYREPVVLGEHRMMFRPREGHDLRLIQSRLRISPHPSELRWLHDPFDNSVAIAAFEGETTELSFESMVTLEHFDSTQPEYPLEDYARSYPFRYSDEDFQNLARALTPCYNHAEVSKWVLRFLDPDDTTPTMTILTKLTRGIQEEFEYTRRDEKGVQSPAETLQLQAGSCRDFAVLMMEAARSLGIAARFVSGYIFTPDDAGLAGGGAMHAWMQAYLPGAGWIDFDPTNRIIGNRNLIRVAVAWSPDQVLPLWGTYSGPPDSFIAMDVEVRVAEATGQLAA
jgi:transglutaminase-like putative cysteine protease